MSQSSAPATQNDMTTCLETFEKEMFCTFPLNTARPQEVSVLNASYLKFFLGWNLVLEYFFKIISIFALMLMLKHQLARIIAK
jgi:hypothetical protein